MFRAALITVSLLLTLPVLADAQARGVRGGGGRRVQVNGMQMYYEVSGPGAGEPLPFRSKGEEAAA